MHTHCQSTTIPWDGVPRTAEGAMSEITAGSDAGKENVDPDTSPVFPPFSDEEEDTGAPMCRRRTDTGYAFEVTVKTLTGGTFTVWVQPYTTILEMKTHLQGITGIPPSNQRIIYKGP